MESTKIKEDLFSFDTNSNQINEEDEQDENQGNNNEQKKSKSINSENTIITISRDSNDFKESTKKTEKPKIPLKIRKVIDAVFYCVRYLKDKTFNKQSKKLDSLRQFVYYHEMFELDLNQWVHHSIRVPYLSIFNFEHLKLNVNELSNPFSKQHEVGALETFNKLRTRLDHFMDALIENTNKERMSMNILSYLKFLISNESYIPHKFFSYFELVRLNIKYGQIK